MKKMYSMLLACSLLAVSVYAEENYEGELIADIDHDGKMEMTQWNKFATSDMGNYYQLRVIDDDGKIIWEGPEEQNENNPFVFSALDIGISTPELLADVDMDGYMELLAPELQSDVSPTQYRKLRWKNKGFVVLPSYALMASKENPESFHWQKDTANGTGIWISDFSALGSKDGLVSVDITEYYGGEEAKNGKALIKFDRQGAYVVKWIKKLYSLSKQSGNHSSNQNVNPTEAGATTTQLHHTPPANTSYQTPPRRVSRKNNLYRARISNRDHYNSRGTRLTKLAYILRQDRANYYKYGGDSEDQSENFFRSVKNRENMERILINPIGISYDALQKLVLWSTPLLEIEILSRQLNIRVLER